MMANALSILRMLLAPLLLYSLRLDASRHPSWATLTLLLVAAFSDLADGYLARRYGHVTRLGRVLDPLADKLFVGSLGVGLYLWRGFPEWLLVAILARDGVIVLVGTFLLRVHDLVISPNYFGKYATAILILTALAHLLPQATALRAPLAYVAGCMLAVSSVSYLFLLRRTLAQLSRPAAATDVRESRSA
jgi:CDP-diacylglycerol--glycerol-3-phosphate 3-phosphatidyltransferase